MQLGAALQALLTAAIIAARKDELLRQAIEMFFNSVALNLKTSQSPNEAQPTTEDTYKLSDAPMYVESDLESDLEPVPEFASTDALASTEGEPHELASTTDLARLLEHRWVRANELSTPVVANLDPLSTLDDGIVRRLRVMAQVCQDLIERRPIGAPQQAGWLLEPIARTAPNATLKNLAENYALTADVLETLLMQPESQALLKLLAETQAGLRVAVQRVRGEETAQRLVFDPLQKTIFTALRGHADVTGVFLEFMRLESYVDPNTVALRRDTLDRLISEQNVRREREKAIEDTIKRLEYHSNRIVDGPSDPHDWDRVEQAIAWLESHRAGFTHTNQRVCSTLLRIAAQVPVDVVLSEGTWYALFAAQRPALTKKIASPSTRTNAHQVEIAQIESKSDDFELDDVQAAETDALLKAARKVLQGGRIVILGGESRPEHMRHYQEEFGLLEVIWPMTRVHQSLEPFKPLIRRDGVRAVFVLIRYAGHAFKELKPVAVELGIAFVSVQAGYSVRQLAKALLDSRLA
jgi:hypothetical protein